MKKLGFIFDLDGVIVDTARFHFLAWKKMAVEFDFELTEALNEQLKGVSRVASLNKILVWANTTVNPEKFETLAAKKNDDYLTYISAMTEDDILPGVLEILTFLKKENYPIALGSASKNATTILKKVGLYDLFDTIVDGNSVAKAKPDPEVFLIAARNLNRSPENCVVFEDSSAGITAAKSAKMKAIGLGDPKSLGHAHYVFNDFKEITINFLKELQ